MNEIISNFILDFGKKNELFYSLLKEEDYDFRSKNILIKIDLVEKINVSIKCGSILDLKIATNAFVKSLQIIEGTLEV